MFLQRRHSRRSRVLLVARLRTARQVSFSSEIATAATILFDPWLLQHCRICGGRALFAQSMHAAAGSEKQRRV